MGLQRLYLVLGAISSIHFLSVLGWIAFALCSYHHDVTPLLKSRINIATVAMLKLLNIWDKMCPSSSWAVMSNILSQRSKVWLANLTISQHKPDFRWVSEWPIISKLQQPCCKCKCFESSSQTFCIGKLWCLLSSWKVLFISRDCNKNY